jgi:hypothetical protein
LQKTTEWFITTALVIVIKAWHGLHARAQEAQAAAVLRHQAAREEARKQRQRAVEQREREGQRQQMAHVLTSFHAKQFHHTAQVVNGLPAVRADIRDALDRVDIVT